MPVTLERTPIEKQFYAKALLELGTSIGITRKRTGLANDTLMAIKRSQALSGDIFERVKQRLPQKWAILADDALDLMDRNDIARASVNVRAWIAGVATDKLMALEGTNKPVFNIVNVVGELRSNMRDIQAQQSALNQITNGGTQ